ncbi:hypothetical protein BGX26_009910, partial [Mortierella sp. AD094]
MPHPLDFPEIRYQVATYLGTKDLINCACVSKEWNSTFSCLIWSNIILTEESLPSLTIALIQAHASHIRSLTLKTRIPSEYYLLTNLYRLHSIHVEYGYTATPVSTLPLMANLIENHSSSLKNLTIHCGYIYLTLPTFKAIGICQQLKSLSLSRVNFSQEEFTALLVTCANIGQGTDGLDTNAMSKGRASGLTTLYLEKVNGRCGELFPSSTLAPLSHLEHLRGEDLSGMRSEQQLKLLVLCPNLRSLYWRRSTYGRQFLMDEWVSHMESGMWPLLTSLDVSGYEFHDKGLSRFINSSPLPFEKFLVERTGFGPLAYNSLISTERQYNHIQELNIYGCREVKSPMIQKFMTTMPVLRYFSAGRLLATDILDAPGLDRDGDDHGQEWICKNIRTLILCIDMGLESGLRSSEYAERQRHVYRRLSELKFLEILHVDRRLASYELGKIVRSLDIRLRDGLGQLASLDRIREFLFAPQESMTLGEIEWMISTWKSLKVVSGSLSYNRKTQIILRDRLAKKDIK